MHVSAVGFVAEGGEGIIGEGGIGVGEEGDGPGGGDALLVEASCLEFFVLEDGPAELGLNFGDPLVVGHRLQDTPGKNNAPKRRALSRVLEPVLALG